MRPGGLCQWETPVTPSGMEPAKSRIVARGLNHLRHCVTSFVAECCTQTHNEHTVDIEKSTNKYDNHSHLKLYFPAKSVSCADRRMGIGVVDCCGADRTMPSATTHKTATWKTRTLLLLLLLLLPLSSLCSVSMHIFPRQTMSLGDTLLQLFCLCCLWCLYL